MKKIKYSTKRKIFGLVLILPWILGFLIFTLYPIAQTVIYSFSSVKITPSGTQTDPVGMKNYTDVLFTDPDFTMGIPSYLRQMFYMVPMIVVFSLLFALMLNSKIKGQRIFRAIFFLPVILISGPILEKIQLVGATKLPGVESFFVFSFIYDSVPSVLSDPIRYIVSNIVLIFWFSGVQILIFLSGLQKVNPSLYEAAMVDGASAWQRFWKITIPVVRPFILLIAVYTVVDISMSSLSPFVDVIQESMFSPSKGFGFSSAASWLYFLFILAALLIALLVFGKREKDPMKEKDKELRKKEKAALRKKRIA